MAERVEFYRLTHKFVNEEQDIPEGARQVVYYSLAIGHHVGVLDCFQSLLEIPLEDYRRWVTQLPQGPARRKMEGLLKWGEIEINRGHADDLLLALQEPLPEAGGTQPAWSGTLRRCLQEIIEEPALYLMARRHA